MATVLGANTLSSGGFQVNNSVRFNSADSADLRISDYSGAGTSRRIRTYSMWIKRSELSYAVIFGSAGKDHWVFNANNTIQFNIGSGTDSRRVTSRLFTDITAWYHLVFAYDTTQGTAANRFTLWVNGVETSTAIVAGKNDVQQNEDALVFINGDTHTIGSDEDGASYCDCYMAEWVFVDGQKLDADSFGEFDEDSGIWKPIDVSGITLGTNGFYLDFQTASDLGIDAGNDNDFEPTNLAAIDQSTDTCTNNFCTWNPLANYTNTLTFSEGNLKTVMSSQAWHSARGNFGFSSGKWYWECKLLGNQSNYTGVVDETAIMNTADAHTENGNTLFYNGSGGEMEVDGSQTSNNYGNFSETQVCGVAVDADNNKISIYKNGSAIVSNHSLSTTRTGFLFPTAASLDHSQEIPTGQNTNFGSPFYSESGGNSDGNGYGNFSQAVPSGYFALNTKNLAEYG